MCDPITLAAIAAAALAAKVTSSGESETDSASRRESDENDEAASWGDFYASDYN